MNKKKTTDKHDCHSHNHAGSNIKVAFFLNFGFCIVEVIGGMFTNSIAIISDALHDLGDSFSLALAWYCQKLSKKQSNPKFTYGYRRFSLLGALVNSLVLLAGSAFVVYAAVCRILNPQPPDAKGMLLLALLGIVVNGLAILKLKKGSSLNERAVMLHLLEDVLGWVAVLIAGTVMMFVSVPLLDPLLSLIIACYIVFNIYRNLQDTLKVILQGTPKNLDMSGIETLLLSVDNVQSIHDLHIWTMDGEYNIMTVHAVTHPNSDIPALKQALKSVLKEVGVHHPTIEIETAEDYCEFEEHCC